MEKRLFLHQMAFYSEKLDGNVTLANNHSLSQHNEIYIMDSDGKNVRRLTNYFGYDGGPFLIQQEITFVGEGSHLTDTKLKYLGWRLMVAKKHNLQIWSYVLGSIFSPINEYLIFTTNLHGFQN